MSSTIFTFDLVITGVCIVGIDCKRCQQIVCQESLFSEQHNSYEFIDTQNFPLLSITHAVVEKSQ